MIVQVLDRVFLAEVYQIIDVETDYRYKGQFIEPEGEFVGEDLVRGDR